MKKFNCYIYVLILFLSATIILGGCNKNKNEVNFYNIVSQVVRYTVTAENVPAYFVIGTDNSFCMIDTNPFDIDDYSSTTALNYIYEMNYRLNFPESLYYEIIKTNCTEKRQTRTFNNVTITWYTRKSKGINCTYKNID